MLLNCTLASKSPTQTIHFIGVLNDDNFDDDDNE